MYIVKAPWSKYIQHLDPIVQALALYSIANAAYRMNCRSYWGTRLNRWCEKGKSSGRMAGYILGGSYDLLLTNMYLTSPQINAQRTMMDLEIRASVCQRIKSDIGKRGSPFHVTPRIRYLLTTSMTSSTKGVYTSFGNGNLSQADGMFHLQPASCACTRPYSVIRHVFGMNLELGKADFE